MEFLPSDAEIEARRTRGEGFTRPEIAVLLAYAKLALHDELLDSDVPDDTYLNAELVRYFPAAMRERFPEAIEHHRLRREIVATQLANAVINRGGPGIVIKLASRTGRSAADIARAYALSRDVLGVLTSNNAIDALDNKLPGKVQLELYASAETQVVEGMLWFLANVDFSPGLGALVQRFGTAIRAVSGAEEALSETARSGLAARRAALAAKGVPEALGRRIAAMPFLIGALDASLIAEAAEVETATAAVTLDALHAFLGIGPLLQQARGLDPLDPYERLALDRAISASHAALRGMATRAIMQHGTGEAGLAGYIGANTDKLRALRREIETLGNAPITQARLSVLASQLGEMVG